jgi:hypothetical protein
VNAKIQFPQPKTQSNDLTAFFRKTEERLNGHAQYNSFKPPRRAQTRRRAM